MKLQIREAILADIPDVAVLFYGMLAEDTQTEPSEDEKAAALARLMRGYLDGTTRYILVEVVKRNKPKPVGFVSYELRFDADGHVVVWGNHLYVEPKFRGSEAASMLLKAVEAAAKTENAKTIFVETVKPQYFYSKGYQFSHYVVQKALA